MTLEEAEKHDGELVVTMEPPYDAPQVKMRALPPFCLMDGYFYGQTPDGKGWRVHEDFVVSVELGEDVK